MTVGRKPVIQTTNDFDHEEPTASRHSSRKDRRRSTLSAYDRLIQMLSRRDHSERELRTKLARAEHSEEEIEAAIGIARARKWLPDETILATREAGRLARGGKSPQQIRSWLSKKGLPTTGLAAELAENEAESAYKTAVKTWAKQVRMAARQMEKTATKAASRGQDEGAPGRQHRPADLEFIVRTKVQRLLLGRGFSSSTARAVYARLLKENPLKLDE